MAVKINQLEIENVKRIRAVKLEPSLNGLTVIGGRNNQGKTSVLDAIAWAIGGDRFRPSQPVRDGSVIPPTLHIKLSNGLIVERRGKNSELKITDPDGRKGGQQLLNEFVENLALDLPRFMQKSNREKALTLLRLLGVEEQLVSLEQQEASTYNRRLEIGRIADQKRKFAKEQPFFPDAPNEPISASELIRQQQAILAQNGENQRKRQRWAELTAQAGNLKRQIDELSKQYNAVMADIEIAQKSVADLRDESTRELEQNIEHIETVNRKVRANMDKSKAEDDALEYENQYNTLTSELENIRKAKLDLLTETRLPLSGLSIEEGELTYNGYKWDNLSSSEQLRVATAIVRRLNPKCGFVLLDKLEQLDMETLKEFGDWLESEGLQAIATRVSTGGECSIIIEDGYIAGMETPVEQSQWKAGTF